MLFGAQLTAVLHREHPFSVASRSVSTGELTGADD
jgi:hypothetical protein